MTSHAAAPDTVLSHAVAVEESIIVQVMRLFLMQLLMSLQLAAVFLLVAARYQTAHATYSRCRLLLFSIHAVVPYCA